MTARALLICSIMLTILAGCGKAKEAYEAKFKEEFKKSFVKSCSESATKNGMKEADANSKCECAAAYLANKYSSMELMKLTNADSEDSKAILGEAVNSCK